MLFERNKPYTQETLLDKADILELIQFERFCRDNSLWNSMYECFAEDSTVNISWFKGLGKAFVDASREMKRYAPHQIYNSQIWINQDRAVAIMQATIQTRLPINEVQMQLNSDAKIVYGLVKQDGIWYINNMECVYEKDSLTPVVPSTISLPANALNQYRSSYACLSFCLNYIGYSVNHELQGIDRPEQLNDFYNRLDQWLTYQTESI